MTAESSRDLIDYVDDNSQNEDETPFLPLRPDDGARDTWSGFLGGMLIGIAGGALVHLAPWLGGSLIFVGYGMAALTLAGSRRRFARALGLGFALMAFLGAAMVLGQIFFPYTTASLIAAAATHHIVFISIATLAWPIGFLKYLFEFLLRHRHGSRAAAKMQKTSSGASPEVALKA